MSSKRFIGYLLLGILGLGALWIITRLPSIIAFATNLAGLTILIFIVVVAGYLLYRMLR